MLCGRRFFHVKVYSNDVVRNICVIVYLCGKEYSIKEFSRLTCSCSQASIVAISKKFGLVVPSHYVHHL
jgi:hypothetical protein